MNYFLSFLLLFFCGKIFAQQTQKVNFQHLSAEIKILAEEKKVEGKLHYEFKILEATDSIFLDAKNMQAKLLENSKLKAKLEPTSDKIWILHPFEKDKTYHLSFSYSAKPKQAMYFVGWDNDGSNQVWTQGQGKYTSHWLPSIDDMNDKIEFDLAYQVPKKYQVIANGKLTNKTEVGEEQRWEFDMKQPMSSYLVAVVVGDFQHKKSSTKSGIPLAYYFEENDEEKAEPTYRYSEKIFNFLEEEIGVPFPWQNYKQIPVRDFLYAGMENTTATIFSDMFMTDSIGFVDRNYVNVNAHELAHQWFGNFVTEKSAEHHWLHEGFATYYALLAEREIFGDDYYYFKLFETAEQLIEMSNNGKGESLLNPKASSLTFYHKGAWALHILREKIGDKAFKKGMKTYLLKYGFQNVTVNDFIAEMEKASLMSLDDFTAAWLQQSSFNSVQALEALKKSEFMRDYFQLKALRKEDLDDKYETLNRVFNNPVNDFLGQEAVYQLSLENPSSVFQLYKKAFETHNLFVRQAIATSLEEVPQRMKTMYEDLLYDKSYLTQEKALFNLWQTFPEEREKYLDITKGIEGFGDKNVEMMWLTLNLVTQEYEPDNKSETYKKLADYTSPKYSYEIRQNAFGFLFQIDAFGEENYKDLLQGCESDVWAFKNFCKELLAELLKDPRNKSKILELKNEFSSSQQEILNKQL